MKIIPVLDLLCGHVVHAKRGERAQYRPIESSLCMGSDPMEICRTLLELYPFDTLYIADLDRIQQQGDHFKVIASIRARFPQLQIWLDGAFTRAEELGRWQPLGIRPVIGSESLTSFVAYEYISLAEPQHVLSLDYKQQGYAGPKALLNHPNYWPQEVIGMTLGRVGSLHGPDMETLLLLQKQRPGGKLYAAGGVRNRQDVCRLRDMGIAGALVATALHSGEINAEDLQSLQTGQ